MMQPTRTALLVVFLAASAVVSAIGDEWPQWRGPNRDGVWGETGTIDRFRSPQIDLKWRQPIGSGYCGPTVAGGRVYVTDRLLAPQPSERVSCLDWKTGAEMWRFSYPCEYRIGYEAGPRASITIEDGRAFALGAMGHLHSFDATSGAVLWKHDLNAEYRIEASRRLPIWGIAAAPLVFQDLLIVQCGGADNACVVAFEKQTGKERWRALRDRAQYSAPIIIQQAGKPLLVCWTGDSVAGLDPLTGGVAWQYPFEPAKMPIGVATPVVDGDRLFVSSFYDGSLLLRLRQDQQSVEKVWRKRGASEMKTDALHAMINTPLLLGDHIYGVDSYGELRCLEAATGNRVWEDLRATPKDRWSNIHFVRQADRVWMFNERGELIIAQLSPQGFHEISRAKLIEPTLDQLSRRGGVCWSHPAFAHKHVFARNDREIVCASLAAE